MTLREEGPRTPSAPKARWRIKVKVPFPLKVKVDSQVVSLEIPRFPAHFFVKTRFFIVKKIRKKKKIQPPEKNREKSRKIKNKYPRSPYIVLAKYEKYLT